jgi:hypothetical protein
MPIDLAKFTQLYDELFNIDFTGSVPSMRPPLSTVANVRAAISKGAPFLPLIYRQSFFDRLNAGLPDLVNKLQQEVNAGQKAKEDMLSTLESYYAAIYQHGPKIPGVNDRAQLARFLAVVSNLFRSFINSNKRRSVGVTTVTETPPVAFFQSDSLQGPYTITSDSMIKDFGTPIGIVSLPATYRNHPVIWASLTHEVCGHDVVHADPKLVPELVATVRSMFTRDFKPRLDLNAGTLNALIWSYWMDEAVADVYGVLNMGPIFPINLAAFFAAFRAKGLVEILHEPRPAQPLLSTQAGPNDPDNGDNRMDEHPIDILRLHLAIGVIDSMTQLNPAKRADYIDSVEKVAGLAAGGATEIGLDGFVEISHDDWLQINTTMPLSDAAAAARQVGQMIATKQLEALNHHSIQDVETWDDADEDTATAIAARILQQQSIVATGDDAQLLAGATLAVLDRPDLYAKTGSLLNDALDDSYKRDPIWGATSPDNMFAPSRLYRPQSRPKPAARGATKSRKKAARRSGKRKP